MCYVRRVWGGKAPRRKRIFIPSDGAFGGLATLLADWTQRLGHFVVDSAERSEVDLEVLPESGVHTKTKNPWLVISHRRVDERRRQQLRADGALVVLDGHCGPLDLSFFYAELLFKSRAEQRYYGLTHGRLKVHVLKPDHVPSEATKGRLIGLNRCGGWVDGVRQWECGALVHLIVPVGTEEMCLRARVVGDHHVSGGCAESTADIVGDPSWATELDTLIGLEFERHQDQMYFRALARSTRPPERRSVSTPDVSKLEGSALESARSSSFEDLR